MQYTRSNKVAPFFLLFLCTILFFLSCQSPQKKNSNVLAKKSKSINSKFKEGEDYQLFERARILDQVGISTPAEASSVLLPKG